VLAIGLSSILAGCAASSDRQLNDIPYMSISFDIPDAKQPNEVVDGVAGVLRLRGYSSIHKSAESFSCWKDVIGEDPGTWDMGGAAQADYEPVMPLYEFIHGVETWADLNGPQVVLRVRAVAKESSVAVSCIAEYW
jgi:hypothetical protein